MTNSEKLGYKENTAKSLLGPGFELENKARQAQRRK